MHHETVKETIKMLYNDEILPYLQSRYDDLIIDRELRLRIKAEISRYLFSKVFVGEPVFVNVGECSFSNNK